MQAVREAQVAKDVAEAAMRRVNEASGRELSSRDEQLAALQKQVQVRREEAGRPLTQLNSLLR